MTIRGTFRNGVIVPEKPENFREGMKVTISVPSEAPQIDGAAEQERIEELKRLFQMLQQEKHEERMQLARQWRDEGVALADDVRQALEAWEAQQAVRQ